MDQRNQTNANDKSNDRMYQKIQPESQYLTDNGTFLTTCIQWAKTHRKNEKKKKNEKENEKVFGRRHCHYSILLFIWHFANGKLKYAAALARSSFVNIHSDRVFVLRFYSQAKRLPFICRKRHVASLHHSVHLIWISHVPIILPYRRLVSAYLCVCVYASSTT